MPFYREQPCRVLPLILAGSNRLLKHLFESKACTKQGGNSYHHRVVIIITLSDTEVNRLNNSTFQCSYTMAPRRKPQYTQESIDQQLQQFHLLDPSSSSENLEQLGPLIKQIHTNRQQDAFLRNLQSLIDSKDAEIERICAENYQDFISSVSTLFTLKSYTTKMQEKITFLDSSVSQLGRGLLEKKRALLQTKKTAANLDEAIDTLQACLRVLDVINPVGEMVQHGKYWSALRVSSRLVQSPSHLSLSLISIVVVSRRCTNYALDVLGSNSSLPICPFRSPVSSRPNQRRSDSVHEAMASRDSERQRAGRRTRPGGHGSARPQMEGETGERPAAEDEPSG